MALRGRYSCHFIGRNLDFHRGGIYCPSVGGQSHISDSVVEDTGCLPTSCGRRRRRAFPLQCDQGIGKLTSNCVSLKSERMYLSLTPSKHPSTGDSDTAMEGLVPSSLHSTGVSLTLGHMVHLPHLAFSFLICEVNVARPQCLQKIGPLPFLKPG